MNNLTWKPRLFFSLLFSLCVLILNAQERTISGNVMDNGGEPIIGANVMVKGHNIGAATNIDGDYSLVAPESATALTVSYIGMRDIEVAITGNVVNIVMEEDVSSLDELVVVGYTSRA